GDEQREAVFPDEFPRDVGGTGRSDSGALGDRESMPLGVGWDIRGRWQSAAGGAGGGERGVVAGGGGGGRGGGGAQRGGGEGACSDAERDDGEAEPEGEEWESLVGP